MIIPKSLIDHLEHEINIGNVDKKVQNLILIISEENQKLKKQLEIKHDGFMASVEESCELAKENQELINYLKQEDKDLKENVVNLEKKLRNTSRDSFYYNSYLKTLHRFRAKRELIKDILSKIGKSDK